jgi:hypothetical protein
MVKLVLITAATTVAVFVLYQAAAAEFGWPFAYKLSAWL